MQATDTTQVQHCSAVTVAPYAAVVADAAMRTMDMLQAYYNPWVQCC
jgi:hypothetical protein